MTKGAIATKLGINIRTLRRWELDPAFGAEYKRLVVQSTNSQMPEILDALADVVIDDRNEGFAKFLLQMHGMLKQTVEVTRTEKPIDREELQRLLKEVR